MRLNVKKCKVMHFGSNNPEASYNMFDDDGDRCDLEVSHVERDLGVLVSDDLDWSEQVAAVVSRANRVLGMLKRAFVCRDVGLWRDLYVALVRPHLEYAVQVWNPRWMRDIARIEAVQRRATKIPTVLSGLPYEERLTRMGLTTLEDRRVRGDLIGMYKVFTGRDSVA